MHIREMTLVNWKCFRGVQKIDLKPIAYAVVAQYQDDSERSNWGGKSTILQAPHFALHGEHTERTEDGFITHGEQRGGVEIVIEDGCSTIRVERMRARGKSTQLVVNRVPTPGATCVVMKGPEAEAYIDRLLGLSVDDFVATCYFEQRQMARMVLAKPQDRMDIVGAWLCLDPLVKAEEIVKAELADLTLKLSQKSEASKRAMDDIARAVEGHGDRDGLANRVVEIQEDHKRSLAKLEGAKRAAESGRKLSMARSKIAEYERISEEGKALLAELGAMNVVELSDTEMKLTVLERDLSIALGTAQREEHQRRRVALGQFDGQCPVAGIECPAKDVINRKSKASQQALAEAMCVTEEAKVKHGEVNGQLRGVQARHLSAQRLQARVDALRQQIRGLQADYKIAKEQTMSVDVDALETYVTRCGDDVLSTRAELETAERSLKLADEARHQWDALFKEIGLLSREVETHREAALVFGKTGAQRRVAEQALRMIEDGANDMLQECGIDLSVEVHWSRQGDGLAKYCDQCGQPFGSSQKIKQCTRCGAERGPLLVNKLDIVLSDRSGAAEDLAGAAIQLSASAWLRTDRNSAWSTALLDEPFGQLDPSNRRAFATHLTSMLAGRYGFNQAFVVSHTPDTVNQLAGRIVVSRSGDYSTVRVVG